MLVPHHKVAHLPISERERRREGCGWGAKRVVETKRKRGKKRKRENNRKGEKKKKKREQMRKIYFIRLKNYVIKLL